MLNEVMYNELNKQVNEELFAAYLYYALALHFDSDNYEGFAHWMRQQAQEEFEHAAKIVAYIQDRGNDVELLPLAKPEADIKTPLDAFKASYDHEVYVTGRITAILEKAIEQKDYPTIQFLQWFVEEQVEEEASIDAIVQKLTRLGNSNAGIMALDAQLGRRQD